MDVETLPICSPFEESAYLAAHPDVRKDVEAGRVVSGKHHYLVHGVREGRTDIGKADVPRVRLPKKEENRRDFNFYHRNGFLIINPGIDGAVLDRVVSDLAPRYHDDPLRVPKDYDTSLADYVRIQDAWRSSPSVREVATAPRVLSILKMLYGRQAFAFQTLNFRYGSQQPIHSDTVHFNSRPSGFMVGVWVALEDIDYTRGPLMFYPGSHLLPEVLIPDVQTTDAKMDFRAYERLLDRVFAPGGPWFPNFGLLRRGQALIWAANLHHGGSPQLDRSLTRHSQVTHYFFEDTEYWTPQLSFQGRIHHRNPVLITPNK